MSSNSLSNVNITRWLDLYSTLCGSLLLPLSSVMKTWPGVGADETVTVGTKKTDNLMSSALNSAWILQWEPHCKIVIGFINRLFNHRAFSVCGREQGRSTQSEASGLLLSTDVPLRNVLVFSSGPIKARRRQEGCTSDCELFPNTIWKPRRAWVQGSLFVWLRLPGAHRTTAVRAAACGQPRYASISVGSFQYPVNLHWWWCAQDT